MAELEAGKANPNPEPAKTRGQARGGRDEVRRDSRRRDLEGSGRPPVSPEPLPPRKSTAIGAVLSGPWSPAF